MPHAAMIAALAAGLLGGLHCLAMCGAYVALAQSPGGFPLRPRRAILADLAVAHAARVATYATLGALLGAAGGTALAATVSPLQRTLYVIANLLLLALAVGIVRGRTAPDVLEAAGARAYAALAPVAGRVLRGHGTGARLGLGVLWGLTPCALVYGVLPLALLSGGAWQGAAIMLAFGVGTLPNLLAAGYVVARARRWLASRTVRWAAGAIVAAFALAGLWRALTASDTLGASPFCFV
jgi:sulfite exporter TauE/SafE